MASIHRDPPRQVSILVTYFAFRLPNGKRAFKSTKIESRDDQEYCRTLERASRLSASDNLTESRAYELISEIVEITRGEPLKFLYS